MIHVCILGGRNPRQKARLDFFLTSEDISSYTTTEANTLPGYKSDHFVMTFIFSESQSRTGRGY